MIFFAFRLGNPWQGTGQFAGKWLACALLRQPLAEIRIPVGDKEPLDIMRKQTCPHLSVAPVHFPVSASGFQHFSFYLLAVPLPLCAMS